MKILLVIDDFPGAAEAALGLARDKGAELTALFVLDASWNDYLGSDWLSGSNSRGGFLEYVRDLEVKEESKAEAAFRTFAGPTPLHLEIPGRLGHGRGAQGGGRGLRPHRPVQPPAPGAEAVVRDGVGGRDPQGPLRRAPGPRPGPGPGLTTARS